MTVTSENVRSGPYYPNGVTVDFPFTFRALTAADVEVVRLNSDGTTTVISSALYAVTINSGGMSGTVTFSAPLATSILPHYVQLVPSFLQGTNFVNQGAYLPSELTKALDQANQRDLWLRDSVNRSIRMPIGTAGSILNPESDTVLGFDGVASFALLPKTAFKGDPGGNVLAVGLFSALAGLTIPVGTDVVQTSGYAAVGTGAGRYVSDATATAGLAAAHPLFCKQSANGRYWRLLPDDGFFALEQAGGSPTPGVNNRDIKQGIERYCRAVGVATFIRCPPFSTYELWAPVLSPSHVYDPFDREGPANIFTTSNPKGYWLDAPGCVFACKAWNGTSLQSTVQSISGNPSWRGNGFNVIGGTAGTGSFGVVGVGGRGFTFTGGWTRITGASAGAELAFADFLSNKGFRIQDTKVDKIGFKDCAFDGWGGENLYFGNSDHIPILLDNCAARGGQQSALNPSRGAVVLGGEYGNAPLFMEVLGAKGFRAVGTRFFNAWQGSAFGAALFNGPTPTFPFTWPNNVGDEAELPWMDFAACQFDNCGEITLQNYFRVTAAQVQDSFFLLGYTSGKNRRGQLEAEIEIHKKNLVAAVIVQGPPSLTTAISGASPATNYDTPEDIDVRVSVRRSAYARANGITAGAIFGLGGYIKPESVALTLLNDIEPDQITRLVSAYGTQNSLPKIIYRAEFYGAQNTAFAGVNTTISPTSPVVLLQNTGAAGTYDISFASAFSGAYNYANEQLFLITYSGSSTAGTVMRLLGSSFNLPQDIKLRSREDHALFSWNKYLLKPVLVRSFTKNEFPVVALTDGATITPNFAAGQTFEVTLAGNRTLANPTFPSAGMTGTIRITQDGTGTRTLAYGNNWRFPGGAAVGGVLSVAANAVDILRYTVGADGKIDAVLDKAMAV